MLIVRNEGPNDYTAVRGIGEAALARADEADLVERLREDSDCEVSLVAVGSNRIVGYVLFSRVNVPFGALGLAPVAVAPDRQRSGIGSRLILAGSARARRAGWQGVFVLGDPTYDRRFGFDPVLAGGFTSPFAGRHLMVLALGPAVPTNCGEIAYALAFSR